jgi:hypothetical protein
MRLLSIGLLAISIMTFAACRSTQPTPLGKLIGPTWVLSSVMGVDADESTFSAGLPTLNFLEGERLAGFAGCNHFSGSYMLIGQEVKLHPGAITSCAKCEDLFCAKRKAHLRGRCHRADELYPKKELISKPTPRSRAFSHGNSPDLYVFSLSTILPKVNFYSSKTPLNHLP